MTNTNNAANEILSVGSSVTVWETDTTGARKRGTIRYNAPGFGYGVQLEGETRVDEWLFAAVEAAQ